MNSKQRRKNRRLYRYHVVLINNTGEDYLEQFAWCQRTFGPLVNDGWTSKFVTTLNVNYDIWKFDSEEKAAMFALRWVK